MVENLKHGKEEGNTTRKAETGMMWLQVKKCWKPAEAGRGKGLILHYRI
jgi:hypothetical protein